MDTLKYQNIDNRLTLPIINAPSFWIIQNDVHELVRIDSKGNITFADSLTLEDAKEAIKIVLEAIMKKG